MILSRSCSFKVELYRIFDIQLPSKPCESMLLPLLSIVDRLIILFRRHSMYFILFLCIKGIFQSTRIGNKDKRIYARFTGNQLQAVNWTSFTSPTLCAVQFCGRNLFSQGVQILQNQSVFINSADYLLGQTVQVLPI